MSVQLLLSASSYLEFAGRLITAVPSNIVIAFNAPSTVDCTLFKQQSTTVDSGITISPQNGGSMYGVVRNAGGAGPAIAVGPSINNSWNWARIRITSLSDLKVFLNSLSSTVSSGFSNDFGAHNSVTLGAAHWAGNAPNDFYNGQMAELGVFNGADISDADWAAIRAGTLLLENVAGVTDTLSMLTVPNGATSLISTAGNVFNFHGTVTQGASHPVNRSAPPVNLVVAAMTGSRTMSAGAVSYAAPQAGVTNLAGSPMTGSRTMSSGAISYAPPVVKVTTDAFTAYGSAEPLVGLVVPHTEVIALDGSAAFHIANAVTDGLGRLVLPGALTAGADYAVASWDATGANVGCKIYRAA